MPLAQMIDQLRALVASGSLSVDEACQHVVEYADGGLTRFGAMDMLTDPRSAEERYREVFEATEELYRKILREM